MARKGTNRPTADKRSRFVKEFLVDLNATAAAKRAGYSKKTAGSQGSRLLKDADVQEAIRKALEKQTEKTEVTAESVLRELLLIAKVDPLEAFDENGSLRPINKIPEEVRRAISSVEVLAEFSGRGEERVHIGDTQKIRFWNKPGALNLLGKYLKLWVDVNIHADKLTLEQVVSESMQSAHE